MAARRHLNRAPILEAVIDLRVEPRPELRIDDLKGLHDVFGREQFPVLADQTRLSGTFQMADEPVLTVNQKEPVGCMFRGADQLHILQAQLHGFAISRLAPYADWQSLVDEAKLRWDQYAATAKPRHVSRVAVRYVNRIQLPLPIADFRDWLPTFTDVPAALPQAISEMFLRVVIPVTESKADAILTIAMEPAAEGDTHAAILFDIDVFRVAQLPVEGDDIWKALETLREVKNNFFFEYLSEKTIELFT